MLNPPLLQEAAELAIALAVFIGGGLTLSAILGATWAVVEDWKRERRWNRG